MSDPTREGITCPVARSRTLSHQGLSLFTHAPNDTVPPSHATTNPRPPFPLSSPTLIPIPTPDHSDLTSPDTSARHNARTKVMRLACLQLIGLRTQEIDLSRYNHHDRCDSPRIPSLRLTTHSRQCGTRVYRSAPSSLNSKPDSISEFLPWI